MAAAVQWLYALESPSKGSICDTILEGNSGPFGCWMGFAISYGVDKSEFLRVVKFGHGRGSIALVANGGVDVARLQCYRADRGNKKNDFLVWN